MQEGEQPQRFTVPLEHGWFAFSRNQTFLDETGYRKDGSGLMIYDIDSGEFIPLLTGGGLEIDSIWHPWVIIRLRQLRECQCCELRDSIAHLIEIRRNIWSILGEDYPRFPDGPAKTQVKGAGSGSGGAGPQRGNAVPEGGSIAHAGGETGHEVIVIEDDSDDDMEVVVTVVGGNNGTIRRMVIDDDSSDSDYVDEGSGAGSSDEGEGEVEMDSGETTEVEEEDAVETDEEQMVINELAYLCSQEI